MDKHESSFIINSNRILKICTYLISYTMKRLSFYFLFLEGKHLSAAETAPANKTRAHVQSLSKIKREGIINLLLLH